MNNFLMTLITSLILIVSSLCFASQHDAQSDEILPEEETIGGIGGTGIRSMNRPEIFERPELIERPEMLESRDALDNSLEINFPGDIGADELERPEDIKD